MNKQFICEDNKYRYIYKITIKSTKQYYIGKHSTLNLDDGYMGSGVGILEYYNKYGFDDVVKEIIMFVRTDEELLESEKLYIGDKWKTDPLCLNRVPGGTFNWIWKNDPRFPTKESYLEFCKNNMKKWRESLSDDEYREHCKKVSKGLIKYVNRVGHDGLWWTGKHRSEETIKKLIESRKNNPLNGEKNGMFNKKWIYNPITKEERVIDKSEQLPDGWIYGHLDKIDSETRKRLNRENLKDMTGKIRAYDPITKEIHYYNSLYDIPKGYVRGNPPLSEEVKINISKGTIKGMWKNRDYDKVVKLHRKMYEVYLKDGFESVCLKFKYNKSLSNLLQKFKRYLPEYKSYNRYKK